LLPGLETVQVMGCSTSQILDAASQSTISKPKKAKKVKNDKEVDTKIALHQTEVDALSRKMDRLNVERRQMFAKYNIRSAKEKWNPVKGRELTAEEIQNHHRDTFNRVQNLKKKKTRQYLCSSSTSERKPSNRKDGFKFIKTEKDNRRAKFRG
jgi:hypothetical protein